MATSLPDRCRGALLGLAWGDVLGCPVEGWREGEIAAAFGCYSDLPEACPTRKIPRRRRHRMRPLGLYSDDTQQALALLGAALAGPGWQVEGFATWLVAGLHAGAWRGYGRNFRSAVHALRRGVAPQRAGSPSAGMGAAMRVAPLGALYRDDPATLARAAVEASLTTHADVRAALVAYAVARAVALLVAGASLAEVHQQLPADVAAVENEWRNGHLHWEVDRLAPPRIADVLRQMLGSVADGARLPRAVTALAVPYLPARSRSAHANQGFVLLGGLHALAVGLAPTDDPQEALAALVRQGRDTDTVAAIAGGLLGARFGTAWIPLDRLVDRDRLTAWADALVDRDRPPETLAEFVAREAELTLAERELMGRGRAHREDRPTDQPQAEVVAERERWDALVAAAKQSAGDDEALLAAMQEFAERVARSVPLPVAGQEPALAEAVAAACWDRRQALWLEVASGRELKQRVAAEVRAAIRARWQALLRPGRTGHGEA